MNSLENLSDDMEELLERVVEEFHSYEEITTLLKEYREFKWRKELGE